MDILLERRLTIPQAARRYKFGVRTVWRWALTGVNGGRIKLGTIVIGRQRYTTEAALEQFIAACTAAANGTAPEVRTSRQREAAIAAAEAELANI
jgi:uncharacterized protein DUF1580